MPNTKVTPRKVNFDDDVRLLTKEDARAATNIRFYSSQDNDMFSAESIPSLEEIVIPNKPSGINKCIGTVSHTEKNDLYSFMWNENQNHFIFRFNTITNKVYLVLVNPLLKFNKNSFVNGFAITGNNDDETLLYWTDNINQPRQINVRRAELHTKGDYVNGYDNPLTEEYIRWIKYRPLNRPTIQHGQDDSVVYNNLSENLFQFRYRWKHKDGQYTAYSPISDISVSEIQAKNNAFLRGSDLIYNYINVTVKNAQKEITEIEVIVRNGNDGEWLLFKTLKNDSTQPTQSVRFYNDDTYTLVNNEDALKNYDAVPIQARAVEYASSRSMLANAVDGYNGILQSDLDNKTSFGARYMPNLEEQKTNIAYSITSTNVINAQIIFDTSVLSPKVGETIIINFIIDTNPFYSSSPQGSSYWYFEYTFLTGKTLADFFAAAQLYFFNKVKVLYKCVSFSTTGNDLIILFDYVNYYDPLEPTDSIRIYNVVSNIYGSGKGEMSFKAGAKHPIGIVYEDEAGRTSSVQKPKNNSPYVKFFSQRNNLDERGKTIIDWRVGYRPPIWAKKYKIVYGGNSSVGDFLQYTIAAAYIDINSESKDSNKNIYLTFHNFQGSSDSHIDSYTTSRNPLINYQYKEGDRIRIIKTPSSLSNKDGRDFIDEYLDFRVLGYEYFAPSVDENPFYVPTPNSNINTFGWTLIVEDPEIEGWSHAALKADTTLDNNNWYRRITGGANVGLGNSCLIEIYNPQSKNVKDVFYEFGEEFDIINAGLPTRKHGGARNQGDSIAPINIESTSDISNFIDLDYGQNQPNLYVGDIVNFTFVDATTPVGDYVITRKHFNTENGFWRFYLTGNFEDRISFSVSTITLSSAHLYAAGSMENGDVWMKPRYLVTGSLDDTASPTERLRLILQESVEDYYANDFFKSDYWNKGRSHFYSPYAKQQRRKATLWISEPLFPEDNTNGLSAFNLSAGDKPFVDYDRSHGSIQLIKNDENRLIIFQENNTSFAMLGQAILKTSDDGNITTVTGEIIQQTQNFYSGAFGICGNPEGYTEDAYGRKYFVDIKRGKILRLSTDGLTPISNYKISSYLDDISKRYMSIINSGLLKIYCGFDNEYEELNVTFEAVTVSELAIDNGSGLLPVGFSTGKMSSTETQVVIPSLIDVGTNVPKVSVLDVETDMLVDVDNVYLDSLSETNTIYVEQETFEILTENDEVPIVLTIDSSTIQGIYSLNKGELTANKTNESGVSIDIIQQEEQSIESSTLVFHEPSNSWCGNRDYKPRGGYSNINYQFFSYDGDKFWRHGTGVGQNNFYGVKYKSKLSVIINEAPSVSKIFQAISLEANKAIGAPTLNTNINSSLVNVDSFDKREDVYYAPLMGATGGNTSGVILGIGEVSSIVGNVVTINGYKPDGIFVGDSVYSNGVLIGLITSIDGSSLTLSSVVGLSISNFIYVLKNALIEGDKIRGYYMRIDLETDINDDTITKLYAVNCEFKPSFYSKDLEE